MKKQNCAVFSTAVPLMLVERLLLLTMMILTMIMRSKERYEDDDDDRYCYCGADYREEIHEGRQQQHSIAGILALTLIIELTLIDVIAVPARFKCGDLEKLNR